MRCRFTAAKRGRTFGTGETWAKESQTYPCEPEVARMTGVSEHDLDLFRGLPLPLEAKAFDDASGFVEGWGSTFDGPPDVFGDVITRGAFAQSLGNLGNRPLPMLWSHNPEKVVGAWTELFETAKGLGVKGRIEMQTQVGKEARALLKSGAVSGLSIGFRVAPGGATRRREDGARVLTKLDLHEVSLVAIPANPEARITEVKSLGSIRDLEEILRKAGLSRAAADIVARGGFPALAAKGSTPPVGQLQQLADLVKKSRAELEGILR